MYFWHILLIADVIFNRKLEGKKKKNYKNSLNDMQPNEGASIV